MKSEIVIEGEALVKVRAFSDQVAYPEFLKRFRHSYAFRMNGLADPFWANFERFLVVLWPPFEKGVRSDLIQIVCKDTATFSENLIKFIQRLEVFIDDGLVGQRP